MRPDASVSLTKSMLQRCSGRVGHGQRDARHAGEPLAPPAAHRQAFGAIQPVELLVIQGVPVALQQDVQPPVAVARPLRRVCPQPLAERIVGDTRARVSRRRPRHPHHPTRAAFAETQIRPQPLHRRTPDHRRHHFFALSAFNA